MPEGILLPNAAPMAGPSARAGSGQPVGQIKAIDGNVHVARADGSQAILRAGDPVYTGDELATERGARAGIEFVDGTTFSLAGEGRMAVDELFFHAGGQEGSAVFSVFKGAFAFVSGQIAKVGPEAVVVDTPMGSIGVRGTGGQANPGIYYDQDGTSTGSSVPVLALPPVGSPAGAGGIILA